MVGARFSASVQMGPAIYQASHTMCTGSFTGVKRPERGVDHAEVKETVELYISPIGPSWLVIS
jgi:hypothetical protein